MAKANPITGLIVIGVGLSLLYKGIQRFSLRQKIMNTPTSKVGACAMGAVEVYGKVRPVEPLKSPIDGADCAYYRTEVYRLENRGKRTEWVLIKSKTEGAKFLLEDESGSVLVDSKGAQIEIPVDYTFFTSGQDDLKLPFKVKKLFSDWKVKYEHKPMIFGLITQRESLRVVEKYLAVGDMVYVHGTAREAGGKIEGKPTVSDMCIGNKNGGMFYISDSPEKQILGRMFWDVPLWIGGGIIVTCLGLWIFLEKIGVR